MTTDEIREQVWKDYEFCLRVIDSCKTFEQLNTARQMVFINVPQRWQHFMKTRPLIDRIGDAIFGGYMQERIAILTKQLQDHWWDKVEIN